MRTTTTTNHSVPYNNAEADNDASASHNKEGNNDDLRSSQNNKVPHGKQISQQRQTQFPLEIGLKNEFTPFSFQIGHQGVAWPPHNNQAPNNDASTNDNKEGHDNDLRSDNNKKSHDNHLRSRTDDKMPHRKQISVQVGLKNEFTPFSFQIGHQGVAWPFHNNQAPNNDASTNDNKEGHDNDLRSRKDNAMRSKRDQRRLLFQVSFSLALWQQQKRHQARFLLQI
jgi:hypothetical protein